MIASVDNQMKTCVTTGCVVIVLCLAASSPAYGQNGDGAIMSLQNMHQHPWFWTVMAASVVGWVLGIAKGFSGSDDWLDKYWPEKPRIVVFILDLLIFVLIGGYIGTGIYNPANFVAAIAAGLTWPIGLGALATKVEPNDG